MTTGTLRRPLRVEVTGDLDLLLGDDLEAAVAPRLVEGARVEVDLRGVAFADSSGLGALVALAQQAQANGADLVLLSPSAAVERVLEITGIEDVFHIVHAAAS